MKTVNKSFESSQNLETYINSNYAYENSPFIKKNSLFLSKNLGLKTALLAGALLIVSFFTHLAHPPIANLLLLFVYIFAGTHALIESIDDLIHLRINIDVLMTLAAFFSVIIGSPFEGGLLLVLFAISEAMEEATSRKTTASIQSLHKLTPSRALVIRGKGEFLEKATEDVKPGEKIFIKVGATIPLDGKVLEGRCDLNLAHLTGEPVPVSKGPGDLVPAGAISTDGSLTVEVTTTSSSSTLARIINLITEAQSSKPKLQRFFDKFSQTYALIIISLSALFAAVLPLMTDCAYFGPEGSIFRSLAFLIAASPCALIIAVPTAYLSAISSCAKKGVLLKGGIILDALAKCKSFVFDKTGTLTTAELTLIDIEGDHVDLSSKNTLLQIAASLEKNSTHPIASAILLAAKKESLALLDVKDFQEVSGFGLKGYIGGKIVSIGHGGHIEKESKSGLNIKKALEAKLDDIKKRGLILCILSVEGALSFFTFTDTIKSGARTLVKQLKEQGLHVSMLTGDHEFSARRIAKEVGIEDISFDLRPEDKMAAIKKLEQKNPCAMFGDGINDAPALAKATVGLSMGNLGSDTAIEASDIVLLQDDLKLASWLVKKAHSCTRIVRQNLIFATGIIAFISSMALIGLIPLWLAVVLHEGGTVAVALNGLRLLRK